jgi:hypothetical protein
MEGSWSVTLDGEAHVVTASLPFAMKMQLTVRIDGVEAFTQRVYVALGQLCRFSALGHQLSIKVAGYGFMGDLRLFVDGTDAEQLSPGLVRKLPAPPALEDVATTIVETQRVEEPLGEEMREIDNSQSTIGISRTISVSREWTQSCVLERETTGTAGGEIGLPGDWLVALKATAEIAVRKRYSITTEEKRTYTEELTITVPGNKRVRVALKWKQLWQCGTVLVRQDGGRNEVQIPFRVCVGPTFDQSAVDIVEPLAPTR